MALNVKDPIVGLPTVVKVAEQTAPFEHVWPFAVIVEPVSFRKVISGMESET